jgi:serine/threonine protein kinase/Tfp pilus assembly protein PilF
MAVQPGQTFSHYRFIEKIGEGGMGAVWKAVDTTLDREVAIKVLSEDCSRDPERLGRFKREAKAVAALNHPNIVTVHSVEEAEGVHFITMELVRGKTLAELIPRDGLPLGKFFDQAIALADAVSAAHQQGITHRDLKPDNFMIDDNGRLKVLDFGLAKLREEARAVDGTQLLTATVTAEGKILGSVSYMSPEQAEGKPIDSRSDIFSMGVVLYELATGQRPYGGDTSMSILSSILREEPPSITALKSALPRHLGRIVHRCLAKDPGRRYQTALDLRNELEALRAEIESGELQAAGERELVGKEKSARGRRFAFIGMGAAIVLLLGFFSWFYIGRDDEDPETSIADSAKVERMRVAVLPFENLSASEDDAYFSEGITQDINTQLAKIHSFIVIAHGSARRVSQTEMTHAQAAAELSADYLIDGSVSRAGDRVHITARLIDPRTDEQLWANDYDRELSPTQIFAVRGDVARQVATALRVTLTPAEETEFEAVPTENMEAYNAYQLGRFFWNKRSETGLLQAIKHFEQAITVDPGYALAYSGLADSYTLLPFYGSMPAMEAYPKAREASQKALAIDSTLAEAHTSLGAIRWWHDWDWTGAEAEFTKAIALNPHYPTGRHWYGAYLVGMGRFDEGIAEAQVALELDPLSMIINTNLADYLVRAGKIDEAIEQYHKTRAMDPGFSYARERLGWAYVYQGKLEEAAAEFEHCPPDKRTVGLATVYAMSGEREKALGLLDTLKDRARETRINPMAFADIYAALGEKERVFEWLETAVKERAPDLAEGVLRYPQWDELRTHPRFIGLLNRIGFDAEGNALPTSDTREKE